MPVNIRDSPSARPCPPESGLLLRLLAQRFGIPELAFIPNPEQIVRHLSLIHI